MEYCDRCKKNIAMMYISGKTKLCLDCYNQWMAEVYGLDVDSFQYPKNIAVTDRQGDLHFFNLHHIFFGSMVHWDADEENGDYHVEMDAPSEEPADRQLHNFHKKIAEKLWNRSLEKHSIDGYELTSLQDHGNLDIRYSDERNETVVVIDGKTFSADEFMELLKTYEGWTMQFQIRSASDDVLKENERLMPVDASKETILEELRQAIFYFSEAKNADDVQFVSYKNVSGLEDAVYKIIDKLEFLTKVLTPDEYSEIGRSMMRLLLAIETDDDSFLEFLVSQIKEIIRDKYV